MYAGLTQAQLLANNTWHGLAGSAAGLQVTGLANASHLTTLNLAATGNINFLLEPNFSRTAEFDYAVARYPNTIKTIKQL